MTYVSLALLAGLIVIRTSLSWTLVLEIEGRWPWQRDAAQAAHAIATRYRLQSHPAFPSTLVCIDPVIGNAALQPYPVAIEETTDMPNQMMLNSAELQF